MSTEIEVNNYFVMTFQLWMKIFYFRFCSWSHIQPKNFLKSFSYCY